MILSFSILYITSANRIKKAFDRFLVVIYDCLSGANYQNILNAVEKHRNSVNAIYYLFSSKFHVYNELFSVIFSDVHVLGDDYMLKNSHSLMELRSETAWACALFSLQSSNI